METIEAAAPAVDPGGRPRRTWVLGAVAAVVVAVIAVVIILIATHHTTRKANLNLPLPASNAVVSAGGRQLIALLQSGASQTFHAAYTVSGPAAASHGLQSLEIWQANGQRREDTVISAGGHTDRTASYTKGSTVHNCVQVDGGAWSCRQAAVDQANVLASVVESVGSQSVVVSDSTIGGRKATCFQVGTSGLQLCATPNGIPILIETATASYQLSTLSTSVDSSIFTVP